MWRTSMPSSLTSAATGQRAAVPNTTRKARDMARRLNAADAGFAAAFDALLNAKREVEEDVAASVRTIIADVRKRGEDALLELTAKFDRVTLTAGTLRLSAAEIANAEQSCTIAQLKALDTA